MAASTIDQLIFETSSSIERRITTCSPCMDCRWLEDHIRLHLLTSEKNSAPPHELAEDLIDLVRAYLK
jgi:hypothetical protein